jgi:hypothetical protein
MAASSSSTVASEALILAPRRSTLALFQKLRDENHLSIKRDPDAEIKFAIPAKTKMIPNMEFVHTQFFADIVEGFKDISKPIDRGIGINDITPANGVYVPIEFETIVFIWYMLTFYDVFKDIDRVIDHMKLADVDISHVDAFDFFGITPPTEQQVHPLEVKDLFLIILNSFFIKSLPYKSVNVILIHGNSLMVTDYETLEEQQLFTEERCVSYNDQGPYLMDLYGAFIRRYMTSFMFKYGDIWSINKGRYI